jgi:DNA-binding MarR family transcriptional regulator
MINHNGDRGGRWLRPALTVHIMNMYAHTMNTDPLWGRFEVSFRRQGHMDKANSMSRNGNLAETVELLDNVSGNEAANQRALARKIGISVGLVNALVHRAVRKGLIKIKEVPARRYAYFLTPKGLAEKSKLVAEYLDHSLTFFRVARQEYNDVFARCAASGKKRIVLCGAGELAEIATLAVNGLGIELVAVFDPETNHAHVAGLPVIRTIQDLEPGDMLVITDGRRPQHAYDRLLAIVERDRVAAPPFLRISPPTVHQASKH